MDRNEIIYSRQKTGFIEGHRYANARLFSRPRAGVTSIIVVGDFPNIVEAYRNSMPSVKVAHVEDTDELAKLLAKRKPEEDNRATAGDRQADATTTTRKVDPDPRSEVDLPKPEEMEHTAWPVLRSIAAQVSSDPIHSKEDAINAIEDERKRRVDFQATQQS